MVFWLLFFDHHRTLNPLPPHGPEKKAQPSKSFVHRLHEPRSPLESPKTPPTISCLRHSWPLPAWIESLISVHGPRKWNATSGLIADQIGASPSRGLDGLRSSRGAVAIVLTRFTARDTSFHPASIHATDAENRDLPDRWRGRGASKLGQAPVFSFRSSA